MKRIVLSIMTVGIILMMITNDVKAQVAMNNAVGVNESFGTSESFTGTDASPVVNVSFRALKDFGKRFATTNATWNELANGYIAEFSDYGIKTVVAYGKKGNWFYTVKRYDEKSLPAEIRSRVKSTYYDYAIIHVDEVRIPQLEETVYIVHLKDNKKYRMVRVCGDEMDVMTNFHE
jgi:hypothetical protein